MMMSDFFFFLSNSLKTEFELLISGWNSGEIHFINLPEGGWEGGHTALHNITLDLIGKYIYLCQLSMKSMANEPATRNPIKILESSAIIAADNMLIKKKYVI